MAAAAEKAYDLGVVDVSDAIQTTHDLGGGRVCVITPALQQDGSMILNMQLEESGRVLERFRAEIDKHTTGFKMKAGHFTIAINPRVKP